MTNSAEENSEGNIPPANGGAGDAPAPSSDAAAGAASEAPAEIQGLAAIPKEEEPQLIETAPPEPMHEHQPAPDALPADSHAEHHHQSFWLWVMCLTGVDYFSTLGYQPSIAYSAAGQLSPVATLFLVVMTLFGALPVYCYVAYKSPHGQGSIAMLERITRGWTGKFLVLTLLGFAATDFVITKTLSAADAAEHLVHNPMFESAIPAVLRGQMTVTMFLLVALGATFLRGFKEVIGIAVALVAIYLTINLVVICSGFYYLSFHQDLVTTWWNHVQNGPWDIERLPISDIGTGPWAIVVICFLLFPQMALGLSGFETGVAVMPLVKGRDGDDPKTPMGRIIHTRMLLGTAAVIMSCYLLGSSLVTSLLIPHEALHGEGHAVNRALAYLAHGEAPRQISPLFGNLFGTIYDLSTVSILWFAGASAMSGLLNLVPQYLPRYGMAPEWARAFRPLVIMFTLVNLLVTWIFQANVELQGGAYATGVMVLMSSACVATVIDRYRHSPFRWFIFRVSWMFVIICVVFVYTTIVILYEKPDGIKIAACFILSVLVLSIVSRTVRATELRFIGFEFIDDQSRFLWDSLKHLEFPVLVPHRPGNRDLLTKEGLIRKQHRLGADVPIVFVESVLGDPSDFYHLPLLEVDEAEGRFIIRITRCSSIAHVIAAAALELSKTGKPPEIHFGWSDESPMAATADFVLFGEGNIPWMVRYLIRKAQPDVTRQPRVFIG